MASGLGLGLVGAAISPSLSEEEYAFMAAVAADASTPPNVQFVLGAYTASHRKWIGLDIARTRIRQAWAEFFTEHDVLLCPVILRPPFPHLHEGNFGDRVLEVGGVERPYTDTVWWTILIGMAYLPATVVPAGRTATGIPVGVQIVAPFLEDRTSLAVARALNDGLGGITPPPMALG